MRFPTNVENDVATCTTLPSAADIPTITSSRRSAEIGSGGVPKARTHGYQPGFELGCAVVGCVVDGPPPAVSPSPPFVPVVPLCPETAAFDPLGAVAAVSAAAHVPDVGWAFTTGSLIGIGQNAKSR